ncbi:AAA family ATPase [Stenotrophomonas sp. MH1]|uniref:AAA family ATPase n=1 Tax=Stenotrophomonas capsici TaxID=3110230 RepID=A0ABU5V859_9GAMM|nr:AAA family ATPase [Stenotrophomonas sp. MH1]MEA5669553.1 AAA family ATPase [Stenotrophomonas sp. MH1]
MKPHRVGLVVGKFCPLHRGHQVLLDHAQAACERLVVVSYTRPEFDGLWPARREQWLRNLYPQAQHWVLDDARLAALCQQRGVPVRVLPRNDEDDATHRQFVAWLLHEIVRSDVDAVFTSEAYGPGFAEVLSQEQQQRGGRAVVHVAVDPARVRVPTSGTAIRRDLHAHRQLLAPQVYGDFVRRVVLLGGESTGKSTLAIHLAQRCGSVHAAEYGRELWEAQDGVLQEADLLRIARTQVARETQLLADARRWLVCDTSPLTTLLYAQAMFDRAAPALVALATRRYDLVLLCGPDVPFVQDGTRRDPAFRQWQHDWYVRELDARGVPYQTLHGDWQARTQAAWQALQQADAVA